MSTDHESLSPTTQSRPLSHPRLGNSSVTEGRFFFAPFKPEVACLEQIVEVCFVERLVCKIELFKWLEAFVLASTNQDVCVRMRKASVCPRMHAHISIIYGILEYEQ